jgi:hypothetical protein
MKILYKFQLEKPYNRTPGGNYIDEFNAVLEFRQNSVKLLVVAKLWQTDGFLCDELIHVVDFDTDNETPGEIKDYIGFIYAGDLTGKSLKSAVTRTFMFIMTVVRRELGVQFLGNLIGDLQEILDKTEPQNKLELWKIAFSSK